MKRALICGVSGQDGGYLARHLLALGYEVHGTSRDAQMSSFDGLRRLGIRDRVRTWSMAPNDFRSVLHVVKKVEPGEIYNLSGQSSVGLSFEQPVETMESITVGTLNLLETIRFLGAEVRFYNAGSSECFGDTHGIPADERTPFSPRSPYAVAKSAAHWQVANYREAYNLFACTGVLFNHESSLRPSRFVTKKIVETARRIAGGAQEKLTLGNTKVIRDCAGAAQNETAAHEFPIVNFVVGNDDRDARANGAVARFPPATAFNQSGMAHLNSRHVGNRIKGPRRVLADA